MTGVILFAVVGLVAFVAFVAHVRREARGELPPVLSRPPVRVEWSPPPAPVVVHRTLPPARVEVGAPEQLPERKALTS